MNNITYRTAGIEDLQAILELISEVKAHNAEIGLKIWQSDYPNATHIVSDLQKAAGRVIENEDGEIIAYTAYINTNEEYGEEAFKNPYLMTFSRLMVSQKYQGQGIGRFFIQQIIQETRMIDADGLALTVDNFNEVAINLYKSFGFKKIGIYHLEEFNLNLDKYLLKLK